LNLLELDIVALEIGSIPDQHHRIALLARPFDVHAEVTSVVDDPVEDVIGGDG
jgi:hypothetical protein